ncbi:MAG TPA: FKBP-type peptidyl-prolyl cis-trans isomerase [Lautropia sp.]|nr:FKBP-type peptidyl-prolyl cis-trans isomerase [Lautropia sp.]
MTNRYGSNTLGTWIFTAAGLVLSSLATLATAQAPATSTSPPAAAGASETLPSGVAIRHTTRGTGPSPTAGDTVKVHYRGTLADGKEFDSSYKRGQPTVFPLARVVPCWTQGLQTLKVGGKATITCPPATAYGARGVPNVIPPDSTLTFEIELLSIERS